VIKENLRRKLESLVAESSQLASAEIMQRDMKWAGACEACVAGTMNAIELVIPLESHPYRKRIGLIVEEPSNAIRKLYNIAAVLETLLSDIDQGLISDFGNAIRAETFDGFLDHAAAYLKDGEKQAAGVLAGVVFEDTIRRICGDKGITDKGRSLEDLINDLAKSGTITPQQSKQCKVASHVRTKATHAQWDEFDMDGVSQAIQTIRRLLQDHLGA
jgi:hypothetical protein